MGDSDEIWGSFVETQKLIVKQRIEKLEVAVQTIANAFDMDGLGAFGETANKYDVYSDGGEGAAKTYLVEEKSEACGFDGCCPSGRICCRPNHKLRLNFFDTQNEKLMMVADRPCKCGQCCAVAPICQQEMTVYKGGGQETIAKIGQPFLGGILSPQLTVMDRDGNEAVATITSDAMCCIGGMCCDSTFRVVDPSTEQDLGKIVKEKPESIGDFVTELGTDADRLTMYVNKDIDPDKKGAIFAALYLIDYMFFENEGDANLDLTSVMEGNAPEFTVKCCDMYCCGCLCPCSCTCGGNGDEGESEGVTREENFQGEPVEDVPVEDEPVEEEPEEEPVEEEPEEEPVEEEPEEEPVEEEPEEEPVEE